MFLSVIIPTRDRARLLDGALSSLSAQTYPADRYEVLVVDNGSRDDTKGIVESHAGRIRHLRYHFDDRPGLHVGRHVGLREAKSGILVYADDDIEATPTWLEGVAESFREDDVVLAGGRNLPKFETTPPDWIREMWTGDGNGNRILGYLSILDLGNEKKSVDPECVFGCNYSIRKTTLLEAGGFHPDSMPRDLILYRGDGETHVSRHVSRKGYRAMYDPKASIYHLVPSARLTTEYFCRRAYDQGISDSYTRTRDRALGTGDAKRPEGGFSRYCRRFAEMTPAELVRAAVRKLGKPDKANNPGRFEEIHRRIRESYERGFRIHQDRIATDPKLLEWVVKDHYLDG